MSQKHHDGADRGDGRDGLVTRRRDPRDGRSWIVSLTPQAIALRELLLPHAMEVNPIAETGRVQ